MEPNDAAYSLQLLKRAITGFATFHGRSRRSEIAYYWMATMLAAVPIWIAVGLLSWRAGLIFALVAHLVLVVPTFAMFARRLHDQGLSARGVAMLPPVIALNIYDQLRVILHDAGTGASVLPELPGWVGILWFLLALAYLIFLALPGTKGPNSYGADPRAEQDGMAGSRPVT